jgi:hypothetical protein
MPSLSKIYLFYSDMMTFLTDFMLSFNNICLFYSDIMPFLADF